MVDNLASISGAIMRGTTPTIIYDLGFDVSEVTSFILYFMQGNKVKFTKYLSDCETEDGLIYTELTQNDTYKLSAKKRLEVRCRFKRNNSPVVGVLSSFYDVYDSGKPEENLSPTVILPAYIRITVLPDKIEYNDGESISIDGIEVKAYYESGTEWGIVPFNELTFEPIVATNPEPSDIYSDGDGVVAVCVPCAVKRNLDYLQRPDYVSAGTIMLGSRNGQPLTVGTRAHVNISEYPVGTVTETLLMTRYNGDIYVKRMSGTSRDYYLILINEDDRAVLYGSTSEQTSSSGFTDIGAFSEDFTENIPTSTKNPMQAGEMRPRRGSVNFTDEGRNLTDISMAGKNPSATGKNGTYQTTCDDPDAVGLYIPAYEATADPSYKYMTYYMVWASPNRGGGISGEWAASIKNAVEIDGRTAYYNTHVVSHDGPRTGQQNFATNQWWFGSSIEPMYRDIDKVAWAMVYDTATDNVAVSWDRGDGQILTDTYDITVS